LNKNKTNEISSLEVLNVEHRVKQVRLNYAHNIINNAGPSYSKNHFIKIIEYLKDYTRSIVLTMLRLRLKGSNQQHFITMQFKIATTRGIS
jgi:hypothetical protein